MAEEFIPPEHSLNDGETSTPGLIEGGRHFIAEAAVIAERIARYRHLLDIDLAERDSLVLRMHQSGFTYDVIGEALSISGQRAGMLARAAVQREEWPTQEATCSVGATSTEQKLGQQLATHAHA